MIEITILISFSIFARGRINALVKRILGVGIPGGTMLELFSRIPPKKRTFLCIITPNRFFFLISPIVHPDASQAKSQHLSIWV